MSAVSRIITELTARRMASGLSLAAVAAEAGINGDYLGVLEMGQKQPHAHRLDSWAGVFGLQLALARQHADIAAAVAGGTANFIPTSARFAEVLREDRTSALQRHRLTQFDISDAVGGGRTRGGWLERGDAQPLLGEAIAWADLLGYDIALVKRTPTKGSPHA
jgi:transcriptional regulator with XRE-family HTH domain